MRRVAKLIFKPLVTSTFKSRIWKLWYQYFERKIESQPLRFMNYGFLPSESERIPLSPEDESERVSIQLYDRVLGKIPLDGALVLEISSGRGGGADYLRRTRNVRRVIALDRTQSALVHAARRYAPDRLSFAAGDALAIPLADGTVDAVINVEASHCYPDFPRFISEVHRVLRPGGHFLYADFRRDTKLDAWFTQLQSCGLRETEREDLTPGVVASLTSCDTVRSDLIRSVAPRLLRNAFNQFAGTKRSIIFRAFENGKAKYMRFVLQRL